MILVADGNADVRNLLYDVLTQVGYRVILAEDGQEAVDKFEAHADSIRLVLLDTVMPKKNGIKSYREIKNIRADMKVLLLSGYAAYVLGDSSRFEDGTELVNKPFSPVALTEKIRNMLDNRCGGIAPDFAGEHPWRTQ